MLYCLWDSQGPFLFAKLSGTQAQGPSWHQCELPGRLKAPTLAGQVSNQNVGRFSWSSNTHALWRASSPSQSVPLEEGKFPSQAQPYWAHRGLSSGLGGEEVALLHGKIKPFVREQGPAMGHADT